jgi:hypothetical protein
MSRRRHGRALSRRYGRASTTADELYLEAEAAYKRGLAALRSGDFEAARVQAIHVGAFGLKAHRKGLDPKKFGVTLRAQSALFDSCHARAA